MTVSIACQLADGLGQHRRNELNEYGELRSIAYTLSPIEYRHEQPKDIGLDLDHERQVGSVQYLERTADWSLWAVAVSDDDWLLTLHDVYASTSVLAMPDGTDIQLRSVALTADPAGLGLRPATIIPGDFRRSDVRCYWHNRTPSRALFERAATYVAHRGNGPIRIAGPVPIPPRLAEARHIAQWVDEYDRPMAAPLAVEGPDGRPVAAEVEVRPGRIIGVH